MTIIITREEKIVLENGVKISVKVPKFIDDWATGSVMGYPEIILRAAIVSLYIRHHGNERFEEEMRKELKLRMKESQDRSRVV